ILVNSHVPDAWILLSVEAGNEVLMTKVVKAQGKSHVEKLTVAEGWIPNVWVKALTIRDRAIFMNRRQVIVPPVGKFLDVKVVPAKSGTYLPGEEAEFTVTATNANGEPAEAELAVAFVDKSIYYIQGEITADVRKFFYGSKRGDRIRLNSSFDFNFQGSEKAKPGHALRKYRSRGWPSFMRPWWYNFAGMAGEVGGLFHKGLGKLEERQKGGPGQGGWGFGAGETGGDADGGRLSGRGGAVPPGTRSPADPGAPAKKERLRRAMDKEDSAPEESEMDDFGGDAAGAAPKVRKHFPDTAFWNAHVTTGKDGKATVKFPFPDSLTTWKATAVGATKATAVGTGRAELVTTKNIIIRLQAPRFFRERDELVVSGIVHNYFDEEVDVTAAVTFDGGCLELITDRGELSKPSLSFKVGAKKEQRVDWWFRVVRPGRASITIEARSERESDAMVLKFPVYEHGVEKYIALSGSMVGAGGKPAEDGAAEMSFLVPDDRHEESTDLTVTINPSLAAALLETLPYLADYPYGCVEQTMSRFLPTVVVKKTLTDLGYTLEDLGVDESRQVPAGYWGRKETQKLKVLRDADLAKATAAGLKRLADFQNPDGSWGWFKGARADLRMTSYVVSGLMLAHRAGVAVDRNMIQRGAGFLWGQVKDIDPDHLAEKGMPISPDLLTSVVTVLVDGISLKGEAGAKLTDIAGWLFDNREDLGAVSRARLARVLAKLDRVEDAKIVCENLTDQMELDGENGTCRFGRASGYYRWRDDAVEATSEALRAYLVVQPSSEMIPMMAKWLVGSRRGAHWKSTMDTAHAVIGLCDYLRVSEELAPDMTVVVKIGDRITKTLRITKENVFTLDNSITLRGADLAGGNYVVSIEKTGKGNLYYSGALTVFTREEDVKAAGNEIAIERRFFRVHEKKREVEREVWVKDHKETRKVTETYEELEPLVQGAKLDVGD
ncbi:MAG: alpha-2-macroglobulin family protein, partial [Planctomycetota bacterium]